MSLEPQTDAASEELIETEFLNKVANKMIEELTLLNGMHAETPASFTEVGGSAAGLKNVMPGSQVSIGNLSADFVRMDAPADYGQSFYFLQDLVKKAGVAKPADPVDAFDVDAVRGDFPILHQEVNGKQLIWLDNAATTQKPRCVMDKLVQFYEHDNSNVHRGAHALAARATDAYEGARKKVQEFLGASCSEEIVFVRGTTEAINLVAQTYGRKNISEGDEIIISTLEHHANIVPWQLLCREKGAVLRVIPISDEGQVMVHEFAKLLCPRTRLVAISHVSNVLGTVVPIRQIVDMAHAQGVPVLVDGAQAVPHIPVNVQTLDCDFYAFSGHKLFGPTGIGVLYGKKHLLDEMPPWQGGGGMIENVTLKKTTFNKVPVKFEAGTPNIADAVGLGAAIDYLNKIGRESAAAYEKMLMSYATAALSKVPCLRQFGTTEGKVSTLAFVIPGIRPEDMGAFLDREGIAVRAGHHCAQPTMARYGLTSMVRPSIALYNTKAEIDALVEAILKAKKVLKNEDHDARGMGHRRPFYL